MKNTGGAFKKFDSRRYRERTVIGEGHRLQGRLLRHELA
jgi:hypothetical protein